MGAFAVFDPQEHSLAIVLFGLGEHGFDIGRLVDGTAARLQDDVANLQAFLRGHAIGIEIGDHHTMASRALDAGGGGQREA